jgi:outer membrane protein assembly factor BamB
MMRSRLTRACTIAMLLASACGSATTPGVAPKPSASVATTRPAGPTCARADTPALTPELARRREESVRHLVSGRSHDAIAGLHRELRARPVDVGAFALLAAAHSQANVEWTKLTKDLGSADSVEIGELPNAAKLVAKVVFPDADRAFELGAPVEKSAVDDDATWFVRQGIDMPGVLDDEESSFGATVLGSGLTSAFHGSDHQTFLFDGRVIVARARDGAPLSILSLAPGDAALHVQCAAVAADALIVEIELPGPDSDGPHGGFLAAIDLATGAVRWVSEPGIATASSFVVAGHYAITGAADPGDTEGHVVVVDLTNGRVKTRTPLGFSPTYVVVKEGRLLVRGTAREASLPVSPSLPPPALARLAPHADEDASRVDFDACVLGRALAALDARDGRGALMELGAARDQKAPAVLSLRAAADFLDRAKIDSSSALDLTAKMPLPIDDKTTVSPLREAKLGPPPVLTKKLAVSTRPPPPSPAPKPPANRFGRPAPLPQPWQPPTPPPIDSVPGPPFEIPDSYADASISRELAMPGGNVLIYGTSYVAVLRGSELTNVFDLSGLVHPDGPVGQGADLSGVGENILDAAITGGMLFVAIGESGVPVDQPTHRGFLVALDVETGALLWRTGPLIATTRFVLAGDYLIAAGGSAGGASRISIVRRDTGVVVSEIPLASVPTDLGYQGRDVVVLCRDEYLTFAVKDGANTNIVELPKPPVRVPKAPPPKIDF